MPVSTKPRKTRNVSVENSEAHTTQHLLSVYNQQI